MFTDLLTPIIGTDWASLIATIIWIAIVIALFIIVWKIYLTFSGGVNLLGGRSRDVRLAIIDAAPIDQKRRIVLVRRDGVEHLVMIGGPNDVVIEQGIKTPEATSIQPAPKAQAIPQTPTPPPPAMATPQKTIQAAAPTAPIAAAAPEALIDDLELEDDGMFDSLIEDRVTAAKHHQQSPVTPAAPKPAAAPMPAAAKAAPEPAPTMATSPKAPKPSASDISLEDEMQALIRDLKSK